MIISLFSNEKDNIPKVRDLPWEKLAKNLLDVERTECSPCPLRSDGNCKNKYGQAWSPAGYSGEGERSSARVEQFSCAVFDLDDCTFDQVAEMGQALEGLEYVVHSSHNHLLKGIRLRLVLPFDEPFKRGIRTHAKFKKDWQDWREACIAKYKIPADPSCKDLSRLYFFGTSPTGDTVSYRAEGRYLACDSVERAPEVPRMASTPQTKSSAQEVDHGEVGRDLQSARQGDLAGGDVQQVRGVSEDGEAQIIDLEEARKRLRASLPADLSRQILSGDPLASEGNRDNTINSVASKIAWSLPTIAEGAILELLTPSIAAMLPSEGLPYWLDKFTYSYRRATERRNSTRIAEEIEREETRQAIEEFCATNTKDTPQELPEPENWRDELHITVDKDGNEHVKNTAGNLSVFLRHDPIWKGAFKLNELTHQIDLFRGPLDMSTTPDALASEVSDWFMNRADSSDRLNLQDHIVKSRIFSAAQKYSFDPLKEHLLSLKKKKDGRLIDTWAVRYLGAKTTNDLGEDITDYVNKVGKKWLVQAVARALEPGCQADACLILEGKQRLGKTSALRILGGAFHKEASLDLSNKDALQSIAEMWLVEIAELAAFKGSETERIKDFLTRRNDFFRLPYAARMQSFPRRCVFAGTTNDDDYLKDITGNSRYWILLCLKIDLLGLMEDRDQLFAEAVEIYLAGFECPECQKTRMAKRCEEHSWFLGDQDREVAERQAEQRMEDDGIDMRVKKWWVSTNPKDRGQVFSTLDVATGIGWHTAQVNHSLRKKIARALNKMKFRKRHTNSGNVYMATKELADMPFNVLGIITEEVKEIPKELRS